MLNQVWHVTCHELYIYYANYYMLHANFNVHVYWNSCTLFFSCYVKFKTCCLIIEVLYVKICTYCVTIHLCYICVVLSFLSFVVSTQIYVASRFVDCSTFSITPWCAKFSSLAVACGCTTLQDIKLRGTKTWNGVVFVNRLFISFHTYTQVAL